MLNHNASKASSILWDSYTSENVYSRINAFSFQISKYFSDKPPRHSSNRDTLKNSYSYSTNNLNSVCQLPIFSKRNNSVVCNCNSLTASPNLETALKYIRCNTKSHHLFSQQCLFRTMHNNTDRKGTGLITKMRAYLGLKSIDSTPNVKISKDLEHFQMNLNKENLGPENSQRILLAFVEGYVLAKENLALNKSPSRKVYFIAGFIVAGMLFTYVVSALGGNLLSVFKSSNISVELQNSNTKFSDVKGAYEAKEELKNVVEFLKKPEKFSALGGKLPKGVLLVGPPGTGKTLLARAVAGEAGVPFFSTSGSEFDEIYVGVGAKRVRELFKLAKENIPCVIFIDEIDSIGKERTSSSLHPHANDTINQLLTEMDGFRNSNGIIVLGATNRKEDLDKALLRPGRFDVEVSVSVPDYKARKELFEFYLNEVRHQSIDYEKLARGTTNFTGADIENMVNQAALRAAVIGAQYVTTEHLEHSRDKALMGPASMSRITDEETNKITAYHEGGHTVVAYFTENSQPLHKVTIIARGSSLGHTAYIPDKDIYHVNKTQILAMLDSMMGGRAAEELVFGTEKVTSGASSDLEKATELASKMVKMWGMSDTVGLSTYNGNSFISPQSANLIDMEIKKILKESYERAKNILIAHKDKHKELSEALLKYETLDADEIASILKGNINGQSWTKP